VYRDVCGKVIFTVFLSIFLIIQKGDAPVYDYFYQTKKEAKNDKRSNLEIEKMH